MVTKVGVVGRQSRERLAARPRLWRQNSYDDENIVQIAQRLGLALKMSYADEETEAEAS